MSPTANFATTMTALHHHHHHHNHQQQQSHGPEYAPSGAITAATAAANEEPMSRTYQYRKVMKPMLERKRRARINRCLDELKELMVSALQNDGENVSKLEKADILELTVRHLHTLKRQRQLLVKNVVVAAAATAAVADQTNYADRFREGFTQCAQEVSQFITTGITTAPPPAAVPPVAALDYTIDPVAGRKLLQHLGACVRQLENNNNAAAVAAAAAAASLQCQEQEPSQQQQKANSAIAYSPPASPAFSTSSTGSSTRASSMVEAVEVVDCSSSSASAQQFGRMWRPW